MGCDRTGLLGRLLVQDPEALESVTWAGHLDECAACREERDAMIRSLAVYRHLERVAADEAALAPSWSKFSRRLENETRRARRAQVRAPWIYGIAGALIVGAVFGGSVWIGTPGPAHSDPAGRDVAIRDVPAGIQPGIGQAIQRVPGNLLLRANRALRPQMSRVPLPRHTSPPWYLTQHSELLEMSLGSPLRGQLISTVPPGMSAGSAERRGAPALTVPVSAPNYFSQDGPGR